MPRQGYAEHVVCISFGAVDFKSVCAGDQGSSTQQVLENEERLLRKSYCHRPCSTMIVHGFFQVKGRANLCVTMLKCGEKRARKGNAPINRQYFR